MCDCKSDKSCMVSIRAKAARLRHWREWWQAEWSVASEREAEDRVEAYYEGRHNERFNSMGW